MNNTGDEKIINPKDTVEQLVDAIVAPKEKVKFYNDEEKEKYEKTRKKLTGRALEYLMFMDD